MAISAHMINQSAVPIDVRSIFKGNLQLFTSDLQTISRNSWTEVANSNSARYEAFMTEKNVQVWELIDTKIECKLVTLVDALKKMIEESEQVLASEMWQEPKAAVFYLFRNGLGETYRALGESKAILMKSEQENIRSSIEIYYIYILIAFFLLSLMTFIFVFIIYRMEVITNGLSLALLDHPVTFYYQEKHRVDERLQERYDFDVDFSLEQPFRGKRKNVKVFNPIWRYFFFLVGFWAVCIGFYFYFYFEICMKLSHEMQTAPIVLSNDAIRLINVIEADVWLTEDLMGRLGCTMFEVVPNFGIIPSPKWKLTPVLNNIKFANKILFDEVLHGFEITSNHFDFLYKSTNFTSPLFRQGYRVGNKAYLDDILYCMNTGAMECLEMSGSLYNLSVELARNSYFVAGHYKEDCSVIVEGTLTELTTFMLTFSITLLCSFILFHFLINKPVHQTSRGLLKLASLMSSQKGGGKVTGNETTADFTSTYK